MDLPPATSPRVEAAFKVADEICSRLFDHRQFTQGQLRYFVKEFEEKRKNKEGIQLNETDKILKDLSANKVPLVHTALSEMSLVADKVDRLVSSAERVLAHEITEDEKRNEKLQSRREERGKQLDLFRMEMKEHVKDFDSFYAAQETDLRKHYTDLEQKLNISSNP